ncbi:MAG: hypothetical protein ACXWXM_10350 [Actinomycetota bacterium]
MSGARIPDHLVEFVKLHRQVEGVIQHVGLRTWDLLLVDVTGLWDRDELPTKEAAEAACRTLRIPSHQGWDDARLVHRMNGRDHWNTPDGKRRAL